MFDCEDINNRNCVYFVIVILSKKEGKICKICIWEVDKRIGEELNRVVGLSFGGMVR